MLQNSQHRGEPIVCNIEQQKQWELGCVQRGVERFQRSVSGSQLEDTPAGVKALRHVMSHLVPAVEQAQEEALNTVNERKRPNMWMLPILCLEADKMAYITARTCLQCNSGQTLTSTALTVGNRVQCERELELWRLEELEKQKKAKESDTTHPNRYRLMLDRCKNLDERAYKKWSKKYLQMDKLGWPLELRVQLGVKLIDLIVRHGGGWFTVDQIRAFKRGKSITENRVNLTEEAKAYIKHTHEECEISRPWLTPMICEPRDWRMTIN